VISAARETQPRVAVLFAGDARDPDSWSGIPASLVRALEGIGTKPDLVNTEGPRLLSTALLNGHAIARVRPSGVVRPVEALRRARQQARVSPALVQGRRAFARRGVGRLGELDAIVQIHSECDLDGSIPFATFDDLTIHQALRHGYREWTALSAPEQRRRVAQQGTVYQHAHACCVTSSWVRDSVVRDYRVPPGRVHVVGQGCEQVATTPTRDWSAPRFLFVGVEWERKNGDAVVRAFSRLRSSHPGAELHLVGGHPRVATTGVFGHGRLRLGCPAERERVLELFRRSTCFVMPSWVEPSAIAYLEAASFGLPSIATTVGGSSDLVGEGGILVRPGDDEALMAAMDRLSDPQCARALGAIGRARSELFTWPRVAARILTALQVPGYQEPPLTGPAGSGGNDCSR